MLASMRAVAASLPSSGTSAGTTAMAAGVKKAVRLVSSAVSPNRPQGESQPA